MRQLHRLKELENAKLKQMYASLALDNEPLREMIDFMTDTLKNYRKFRINNVINDDNRAAIG